MRTCALDYCKVYTISLCSTTAAMGGALRLPCSGSQESMKSKLGCKVMSPGWIMSAFPI